MLSAISSQNGSSVNFCGGKNPIRGRDARTYLCYLAKRTDNTAKSDKISLVEAYNIPCRMSSRVNHLPNHIKYRCPTVGKMKLHKDS